MNEAEMLDSLELIPAHRYPPCKGCDMEADVMFNEEPWCVECLLRQHHELSPDLIMRLLQICIRKLRG